MTMDKGRAMMDNGARTPGNAGRSVMVHVHIRTITFEEECGLATGVEEEEEDGVWVRHQAWFNIATTRGIDLLQRRECDKRCVARQASGSTRI